MLVGVPKRLYPAGAGLGAKEVVPAWAGEGVAVGVQLVLAGCGAEPPDGVGADSCALVAAEPAGDDRGTAHLVCVRDGEAAALLAPFADDGLLTSLDLE